MFNVEIELLPPAEVLAADFAAIGLSVKSFREPLKRAIQQVVAPSIQSNFDVGGRPPWEPLADKTLEDKARQGYPSDTLIRTGKLRRVAGQLNVWTIGTEEAFVDRLPGAEYGVFHQDGTRFMPARPFMTFDGTEDQIDTVFANWLVERFERRGFGVGESAAGAGLGGFGGLGGGTRRLSLGIVDTVSDIADDFLD